jgi:homoserine O-succinyltransferase
MPVLLPSEHPASNLRGSVEPGAARALRVGIINIMPQLEAYEPMLLRWFADTAEFVEPVFIRLETHGYASSDAEHLQRFYCSYRQAGALDGLILTGAPVEELLFEQVRYWDELTLILRRAVREVRSTLGLCWGGMAIAAQLGVPKVLLRNKLFGSFRYEVLEGNLVLPRDAVGTGLCAQSRHAGVDESAVELAAAAGQLLPLAWSAETGYTVLASPDYRLLAHLGHPEYEAARLVFEYQRDLSLGREDVPPPREVEVAAPRTTWKQDSDLFFGNWLRLLRS